MSSNVHNPLHFVTYGHGTPVLALHGWTPDHRLMTGFLEPVFTNRPGYRRLYPDLPGMGRSPAGESIASTDDMLAAVERFVDAEIGAEPFLLVGESYGGYLSRALACARPRQALGLALVCPVGAVLERAKRTVPPHTVVKPDPGFVAGLTGPDLDYVDMAVVQDAETLRRFRTEIAPGLALADAEAMDRVYRNWELSRAPEALGGFDGPTVIVTGRQDSSTGYADVYRLLEHYPRATFAILDAAGHNLQIEQPRLLESLLTEWLDRVAV